MIWICINRKPIFETNGVSCTFISVCTAWRYRKNRREDLFTKASITFHVGHAWLSEEMGVCEQISSSTQQLYVQANLLRLNTNNSHKQFSTKVQRKSAWKLLLDMSNYFQHTSAWVGKLSEGETITSNIILICLQLSKTCFNQNLHDKWSFGLKRESQTNPNSRAM